MDHLTQGVLLKITMLRDIEAGEIKGLRTYGWPPFEGTRISFEVFTSDVTSDLSTEEVLRRYIDFLVRLGARREDITYEFADPMVATGIRESWWARGLDAPANIDDPDFEG